MNARDDIDLLMARWLSASAPVAAPVAVHVEAMASVRKTRQNARWSAVVRTRFAAPGGQPTIRLFSIVGVAAMLMAGSVGWAVLSAGSSPNPAPSIQPDAAPSPVRSPVRSSVLPAAIAGVVPADLEQALVERGFTCTTRYPDPDERFHVECNKGADYLVLWRGRNPTSIFSIDATVTSVSESYAASFVGALIHVCMEGDGPEEWAFSNIHTGGETTIGPIRIRLTVVSEGTWRIEIRSA